MGNMSVKHSFKHPLIKDITMFISFSRILLKCRFTSLLPPITDAKRWNIICLDPNILTSSAGN